MDKNKMWRHTSSIFNARIILFWLNNAEHISFKNHRSQVVCVCDNSFFTFVFIFLVVFVVVVVFSFQQTWHAADNGYV